MMCMKKISTYKEYKKGTGSIVFVLIIAAGILIGSVTGQALHERKCDLPLFGSFYSGFTVFGEIRDTFIYLFLFITLAFLIGLSAIGQPFALMQLLYCGMSIGCFTASMYRLYGKSAFLPVLLVVLPKAAAVTVAAVLAVRESLRSSLGLLLYYFRGDTESRQLSLKLYCIKYIVLVMLSLIFSASAGAVMYVFGSVGRL